MLMQLKTFYWGLTRSEVDWSAAERCTCRMAKTVGLGLKANTEALP